MEQRVGKLEKDVAVLETRLDTVAMEVSTVRQDIKALSSKMDKATGILLAGVLLAQLLGPLLLGD